MMTKKELDFNEVLSYLEMLSKIIINILIENNGNKLIIII